MSRSVVRQLIVKDLYLTRWMVLGSLAAGAAALAMMPHSLVSGYVSSISLICTLVILNIFLVMSGIVQERKDKVQLFFLSLPVSTAQYTIAKIVANAIGFVVPWGVLTIATLIVIDVTAIPNGVVPFWVAVLVYLLAYYCVLLSVAIVSDSTGWHATTITLGNISVNFLIPFLLSLPSVVEHRTGPVAVWTPDIVAIIAIELGVGVLALCAGVYVRSRAADFV
jgi:ABC-type multidrug transport system permease subunit